MARSNVAGDVLGIGTEIKRIAANLGWMTNTPAQRSVVLRRRAIFRPGLFFANRRLMRAFAGPLAPNFRSAMCRQNVGLLSALGPDFRPLTHRAVKT